MVIGKTYNYPNEANKILIYIEVEYDNQTFKIFIEVN
jgi:hypothetical protein